LASRSIFINMKRRAPDEKKEAFRQRYHPAEAAPIKEALADWCGQIEPNVTGYEPEMPAGIEDRTADCWEPLLAIADAAGSDWPERARAAAVYLTGAAVDDTASSGVELLAHIRDAFLEADKIWTDTLLRRLCERQESPWKDIKGRQLNDRGLADMLRPYGIRSKDIRLDGLVRKGYNRADFADAWRRYLPSSLGGSATSATSATDLNSKNKFVADVADVAANIEEDRQTAFEERVTILEYDAGLPGAGAEATGAEEYPELPAFLDRRSRSNGGAEDDLNAMWTDIEEAS
jgi:hypothetical protein